LEPLSDTIFAGLVHAVPLPELSPVPGDAVSVAGGKSAHTVAEVIGCDDVPWQITTPVATGTGRTVTVIVLETAGQMPAGSSVVSVSTTVPLAIAGVYVAFRSVASLKVPLGALHEAEVAPPPMVPAIEMLPFAQTLWSGPALTVASGLIVRTNDADAEGHGPAGSFVVSVSVTAPAVLSPADGV
jgi:hypothetical protein